MAGKCLTRIMSNQRLRKMEGGKCHRRLSTILLMKDQTSGLLSTRREVVKRSLRSHIPKSETLVATRSHKMIMVRAVNSLIIKGSLMRSQRN
jgi:hypothetical protein